ncbi:hypothetical protein FRX31_017386 [Thalictrum thalictroides]|uniref:Uncharacterized protein n=1 Tax=Thalictrum thalictroides TaxID=46969 RepID=A0A7J6W6M3_THATH|nr:hypothetical protein FRX31_017386 [Thalictrum thalictroides]
MSFEQQILSIPGAWRESTVVKVCLDAIRIVLEAAVRSRDMKPSSIIKSAAEYPKMRQQNRKQDIDSYNSLIIAYNSLSIGLVIATL